jgi:proline iminopeptidase
MQGAVVFYDQLGAGKSDVPEDVSLWTNDRMIEELGQVIDALGFPRVHLLGQSWGTIIAAEYALHSPGRLAGLVLSDPCLSMPRFAAGAAALRTALPAPVRAVLDRHEAAGTMDSEEYQEATMEFYRRYVCRLDPWPDALMRTFGQLNQPTYERMQGPNEFIITGTRRTTTSPAASAPWWYRRCSSAAVRAKHGPRRRIFTGLWCRERSWSSSSRAAMFPTSRNRSATGR